MSEYARNTEGGLASSPEAAANADDGLLDEINKRLTLNLLIQGSAQHAFLTSHYLVRNELTAIRPSLVHLYDQIALAGMLQYWLSESVFINGWPERFWRRTSRPGHPFHQHPLLRTHGLALALGTKKRVYERAKEKKVSRLPGAFSLQFMRLLVHALLVERKHKPALIQLAKRSTQRAWGIPVERLDGALQLSVAFGKPSPPTTFHGAMLRSSAAGYGGVLMQDSGLRVVAKAWVWPLLSHELVKGTAELICLHGLTDLDDHRYHAVLKAADRIEHEPWMLQAGCELWRRLLPLLPDDRSVADMLMHLARLAPRSLESLLFAVIEEPDWARELLDTLGRSSDE